MMNSGETAASAAGPQAANKEDTGIRNFSHRDAKPSQIQEHASAEIETNTVLREEEPEGRETFIPYESDYNENAPQHKKARIDMKLANVSECSSETQRKSHLMNYVTDGIMVISDNEESHKNKVPVQNKEIKHKLSDVDSGKVSHLESSTSSDFRSPTPKGILEDRKRKKYDELCKRIKNRLITKLITPAIDWKRITDLFTQKEIDGLTPNEFDVLLTNISKFYGCNKQITRLHFQYKKLLNRLDIWKRETLSLEKKISQLRKLMEKHNLPVEMTEANKSEQLTPSTSEMSSRHKIGKEGAHDTLSNKCVRKKSTAGEDLNQTERNTLQVRETEPGMIPTQGSRSSFHEAVRVPYKQSSISVHSKGMVHTPVLPKPVSSTKALDSQKQQKKSISKSRNSTTEIKQERIKKCCDHQAPRPKPCTHIKANYYEIIDLTLDDDLQFSNSVTDTLSDAKNMPKVSKAVDTSTVLAANTPASRGAANSGIIKAEPGAATTSTSSYVARGRQSAKNRLIASNAVATSKLLAANTLAMHIIPSQPPGAAQAGVPKISVRSDLMAQSIDPMP